MNGQHRQVGEKVLVLGAGQLGAAVLDALLPAVMRAQGHVTVVVSPGAWDEYGNLRAAAHQKQADRGATFIAVDMATSTGDALIPLFAQFDTVINCMGFVAGAGTQLRITDAVLVAGVRRYFPWQFGVDYDVVGKGSGQPVWDEQYDVRERLRAQNRTEWVIVSTGMFTSFLFEPAFDVVNLERRTLHALGGWDTQVTVTSPADIGRLTTAIYLHQPRIVNEVVLIAGETLSYATLADTVEAVVGQPFKRAVFTLPALTTALHRQPEDQMIRYRTAFARGTGVWWPMQQTWNARQQLPTQDVKAWLQQYLAETTESHPGSL